jgi:inner membrane protein
MDPALPRRSLRDSALVKLIAVGALILALLIPLGMVRSLISERAARRAEAAAEVASSWAPAQRLSGPMLAVPYLWRTKDAKGKVTVDTLWAEFFPDNLEVSGRVLPERRQRGIFSTVVYRAELDVAGNFLPEFGDWQIPPQDVLWQKAILSIGLSDLRGVEKNVALSWRGQEVHLVPGIYERRLWSSGLQAPVVPEPGKASDFSFSFVLRGSGGLSFVPVGRDTVVHLGSTWPDPSFGGAFLPNSRTVTEKGFEATWQIPYLARPYSQRWKEEAGELVAPAAAVEASSFGVELFLAADHYQKTERSVKYAVLFLVLTFVTFFLFEVLSPISLHPVQYLLVGCALCIFYLLLLSLSEHVRFAIAYAAGAAATVLTISGYALAVLRARSRAFLLALLLSALYGYLYVLLQAEDYALLLGSVGLFVILAAVMFLTRRIDWGNWRDAETRTISATPGPLETES